MNESVGGSVNCIFWGSESHGAGLYTGYAISHAIICTMLALQSRVYRHAAFMSTPLLRRPWYENVGHGELVPRLAGVAEPMSSGVTAVTLGVSPEGVWTLLRGGDPYLVRGAGGDGHLHLLKRMGGTTIRTWGIEQLGHKINGRTLLDRCQGLGLTVMAGIWVEHQRHGFDPDDPEQVRKQREAVRESVRRYRHHPAILLWGLGNEMEGPSGDGGDPRVWRELEVLACIIKEEDPDHPVCTVIAGAAVGKVRALMRDYPSLDILGVNAYGSAVTVARSLVEAGWDKPFILAEYGPVGHWEVARTEWGAPIEPRACDKSENYIAAHRAAISDGQGRCLGTFAFVWGQKQETTATWYGMFLASGEKLPAVDAVSYAWTGVWPENRSPHIEHIKADFALRSVRVGSGLAVAAVMGAPANHALHYDWQVVAESTDRKEGGDPEEAPPVLPECVVLNGGPCALLVAPLRPGPYRLFLYVRDGLGGASADNIPFLVVE